METQELRLVLQAMIQRLDTLNNTMEELLEIFQKEDNYDDLLEEKESKEEDLNIKLKED